MKKEVVLIITCCALFFSLVFLPNKMQADIFNFVTVTDIVKKVKKRFAEIDSYQADFSMTSYKLGSVTRQTGTIKYKAANKLLVECYGGRQYRIVSDGRKMWIYIPSMNAVVRQDLKSDAEGIFSTGTKSGLQRLFSKYHYKFASKEQPELQSDGTKKYTLFLKQKEQRGGFRTIKLWISEDFLITKAEGETAIGKKVELELKNIKTDISLPNGLFKFDIPGQAKVVVNPLMSEE
ncbi:MAG: outer-membrane lipoprotein carrier protein LolA [Spirochaetes bacterium]|nr:outer-membrane lipoprotein carrier protein LolA [Spirochaetota bacterium]